MENSTILRAFKLRVEGKSFEEIGYVIGYSADTVERNLSGVLKGKTCRRVKVLKSREYPKLAEYITTRHDGFAARFSEKCGVSVTSLKRALSGHSRLSLQSLEKIRAVAGNIV